MGTPTETKDVLRKLLQSQMLAALSTQNAGQPYGSLVAFAATEDLRHLFFATARATRKYANITADQRVAMLIDSRSNNIADFRDAIATTASGTVTELSGDERDAGAEIYLAKHPYLEHFVGSPSCALLRMDVETYQLVQRFQNVVELRVAP